MVQSKILESEDGATPTGAGPILGLMSSSCSRLPEMEGSSNCAAAGAAGGGMPPRENSVKDSFFLSRLPDSEKLDQILKIESKKSSMQEDASPEKVVIKNTQYFSEPELSPSTSPMGSRPSSPICSDTEFESAKRERVKDSAASQDQHEQVSHSFLCQALFLCNICVVF